MENNGLERRILFPAMDLERVLSGLRAPGGDDEDAVRGKGGSLQLHPVVGSHWVVRTAGCRVLA